MLRYSSQYSLGYFLSYFPYSVSNNIFILRRFSHRAEGKKKTNKQRSELKTVLSQMSSHKNLCSPILEYTLPSAGDKTAVPGAAELKESASGANYCTNEP